MQVLWTFIISATGVCLKFGYFGTLTTRSCFSYPWTEHRYHAIHGVLVLLKTGSTLQNYANSKVLVTVNLNVTALANIPSAVCSWSK